MLPFGLKSAGFFNNEINSSMIRIKSKKIDGDEINRTLKDAQKSSAEIDDKENIDTEKAQLSGFLDQTFWKKIACALGKMKPANRECGDAPEGVDDLHPLGGRLRRFSFFGGATILFDGNKMILHGGESLILNG